MMLEKIIESKFSGNHRRNLRSEYLPNLSSKKGSEFVEAAIVMPLVILISIGIILLCVHFYWCLDTQVMLHNELNDISGNSERIYHKVSKEEIIGISEITVTKNFLSESKIIRTGEIIPW